MTKPVKARLDKIRDDLVECLGVIENSIDPSDTKTREALAHIETFFAIAIRVFAKTNESKLRSEFQTVEICARLAGKHVYE